MLLSSEWVSFGNWTHAGSFFASATFSNCIILEIAAISLTVRRAVRFLAVNHTLASMTSSLLWRCLAKWFFAHIKELLTSHNQEWFSFLYLRGTLFLILAHACVAWKTALIPLNSLADSSSVLSGRRIQSMITIHCIRTRTVIDRFRFCSLRLFQESICNAVRRLLRYSRNRVSYGNPDERYIHGRHESVSYKSITVIALVQLLLERHYFRHELLGHSNLRRIRIVHEFFCQV